MMARTPVLRLRRWQPAGPLLLFAFHLSGPALMAQETTPDWVPRVETLVRKEDLSGALLLLIPLYERSRDDYKILCWMSEVLVDSAGSAIREGADLEAESLSRRAESLARESVRLFQRAIRIEPEVIAHHLELGRKGEARVLMKPCLPADGVAPEGGLNRKVEATR